MTADGAAGGLMSCAICQLIVVTRTVEKSALSGFALGVVYTAAVHYDRPAPSVCPAHREALVMAIDRTAARAGRRSQLGALYAYLVRSYDRS